MVYSLQQNIVNFADHCLLALCGSYVVVRDFELFCNYAQLSLLLGIFLGLMTLEDPQTCPLTAPPSRKCSEDEHDSGYDTDSSVVKELFPSESTESDTPEQKSAEKVDVEENDSGSNATETTSS